MRIIDSIKAFFGGSRQSAVGSIESEDNIQEVNSVENTEVTVIPTSESYTFENRQSAIENPQTPYWLDNEDTLRDEGVIFGLSDSKAEEKISIIKNYFTNQTASIEKEIEQISEKIGEINLLIGQKETRMEDLKVKTKNLEDRELNSDHHLPRTFTGLILSIAMATGNYFLIEYALRNSFQQNAWLISLGVFLAGMFSLFNPKSLFHEKESFNWRQLLEEVGMPLAASLFVFVQAFVSDTSQNYVFLKAFSLFVFVLFLFLFSGKLLLGNLTVFKNDFTIFWDNQILRRDKVTKAKDWDAEIQQLTNEIDEQRMKKWQILPDLNKAEADLARLNAKRDMLIKLFESEFHLARSYKEKLTEKQIRNILK